MLNPAQEIRARFGNVRRARGCWLYTEKNVRLLDLFLDAGAAVLGRRAGRAKLALKNALDRGLCGGMPVRLEQNLSRAACALTGTGKSAVWFPSQACAGNFCAEHGLHTAEWRPWLFAGDTRPAGAACGPEHPPVTVLSAPFPWGGAPDFSGVVAVFPETAGILLPESSAPPCLLAAITRALVELRRALPLFRDEDFAALLPANRDFPWERKGAWLFPRGGEIPQDRYQSFFCRCLDRGFLISPDPAIPSVLPLPCTVSPQERKSLRSALSGLPDW